MDVRIIDRRCDARRGERPFEERHARASINLVRNGSFGYRVDGTTTTLGPGSVMLGNAGAAYVCSHEHAGGDHCLSVSYDAATIADVGTSVGTRDLDAPFALPALPPQPRTAAFAHALAAALRGSSAWSLEELAFELAAWVLGAQGAAHSTCPPVRPSRRDTERAVAAMLWIDDHCGDAVTLADVARVVDTSPFHFLRVFRAVLGVTPHQYLVRRRLGHAAAILLDTDAPVTAIGYDVGFGDLAHFIRSFGRHFGCSPSAFRRAGGLPDPTARNAKSHALLAR